MLTTERFLEKLTYHLDRREFKAALSWCEQGILTLAAQPAPKPTDDFPLAQLPLSQQIIDQLDAHGVTTISQLRAALKAGDDTLYFLGRGKNLQSVKLTLIEYDSRIKGLTIHGQGKATPYAPPAFRSQHRGR